MNVNSLVLILTVFNISMLALTGVGLGTGGLTFPNYSQGNSATSAFSAFGHAASTITSSVGCLNQSNKTFTASVTCIFFIAPAQIFWNTILTFGYFLWAITNVLPFFFSLATMPCTWITNIFGGSCNPVGADFTNPGTFFGLLFSTGYDLLILLWMGVIITGRYNLDIT